jgi:hypothetical protein
MKSYGSIRLNVFAFLTFVLVEGGSQDSTVNIAACWMTGVRFPSGARDFSVPHSVYIGSGAHPASYTMGTGDSFLEVKVDGL